MLFLDDRQIVYLISGIHTLCPSNPVAVSLVPFEVPWINNIKYDHPPNHGLSFMQSGSLKEPHRVKTTRTTAADPGKSSPKQLVGVVILFRPGASLCIPSTIHSIASTSYLPKINLIGSPPNTCTTPMSYNKY